MVQSIFVFVSEKKTKIVLALRNPKDVAVSFYHHHKGIQPYKYNGKFTDFCQLFIEGKCKNISVKYMIVFDFTFM